ncbi:E3 ubiquitin-protein ligase TRIP12-like isoform X2 [Dysidea avara]|uniref:E3 ubiquitin-protein ligase TRIP12-like isoform X2 n=1 Tax=Dysidea avara TaxID=196820 RepID=UPI003328E260
MEQSSVADQPSHSKRRTARKRTRADSTLANKRSVSDTAVVASNCPTSPIQPRRSERLLALKNKAKEVGSSPQSKTTSSKPSKEVNNSKGNHLGESSKESSKIDETDTGPKKQSPGKRIAKKSSSESDLAPKRKKHRAGSPEVKQDLLKITIQRGTSKSASASTKQALTCSKKDKGSSEPTTPSTKEQTTSHKERIKDKTSKTSHKGKGTSTCAVGPRQLRKLKGRNLPAEMSSDESDGEQASGGMDHSALGHALLGLELSSGDGNSEDMKRLQYLLEARGLPPHLLGALGSRIPTFLHRSSSSNSKAQQLLAGIENTDDESVQLQSVIEMCQLLVMGNEETLSGFPVKQAVPALIRLLQMEHNFDMMNNACRALTYMMEGLPRSAVIVATAVPVLLEKLQVIQCMDVAEQALSALEILSQRHSKSILQAGGVSSCLLYLEFFSITTQRCALNVVANCCQSVSEECFQFVADSLAILAARLQHQDKKSVESCCLCFSRLTDNMSKNSKLLEEMASHGLLQNIQQLLVVSPPVISSSVFVMTLKMLSTLCQAVGSLAAQLMKQNIADTLRYLLLGPPDGTQENMELALRSPGEVYEIISLASELLPQIPNDGLSEIGEILGEGRRYLTEVQWEWQSNEGEWREYAPTESRMIEAGYIAHEEEVGIAVLGRPYIVDLVAMRQFNENTGNSRHIRRSTRPAEKPAKQKTTQKEDDRMIIVTDNPTALIGYSQALFGVLYEVYNSMAGPTIRHNCLKAILKLLYYTSSEVLYELLKEITVSSHISTMLLSQDYRIVVGGIQMAEILMKKLPDVFHVYFRREGVMHSMNKLTSIPLKNLATPSREIRPPLDSSHLPTPAPLPQHTPPKGAASRRLTEILRRGRRTLRKSLTRKGQSQDEDSSPPVLKSSHTSEPVATSSSSSSSSTTTEKQVATVASTNTSGAPSQPTPKEKVQRWIQARAQAFLSEWCTGDEESHPALEVLKRLLKTSDLLSPTLPTSLQALRELHCILAEPNSSVSSFELLHCNLLDRLYSFLTTDSPSCVLPLNVRLKQFLHIFLGCPEQESATSWEPAERVGLSTLLQRLHGCVSQLEQFPVKVHTLPGVKGSQSLKFFNTHQIKCQLERHVSDTVSQSWRGGPVKVDPLATIQTIERYMLIRGYGKPATARRDDSMGSDDEDIDERMLSHLQQHGSSRHCLEILYNDKVLPYHLTVFQALRHFALEGESEEELNPLGRASIWTNTHVLHYRLCREGESSTDQTQSASNVEATSGVSIIPLPPRQKKRTSSIGKSSSSSRLLRSASKEQAATSSKDTLETSNINSISSKAPPTPSPSPLHKAIHICTTTTPAPEDPSVPVLALIRLLYVLNQHWTDLYQGIAASPIVPPIEFINQKLSAKAMRQLQDPIIIMTGNISNWLKELVIKCPFLFPFECRQLLFYSNTFDRDRALLRLQEQQPDLANQDERVTPRLDKKKRCVSRDDLLSQAEKVINDLGATKSILEVYYEDEAGTGLGPTLEFFTLVSRELQRADLGIWRGDDCPLPTGSKGIPLLVCSHDLNCCTPTGASSNTQFVHSPVGLFPSVLGPKTPSDVVDKVCAKFSFMGKFVARSLMDSRMLDIPFSEAFYKWILGMEDTFTAQDLQHVDPVMARSFAQLAEVAVKKHNLERDSLLSGKALVLGVENLTMEGGGTIEDLDLDFTLPAYPDIELKSGGKDIPVNIHNLDEYLQLVVYWTLVKGVSAQFAAFREGFNSIFPISSLQQFYPSEMDQLLCGAQHNRWDAQELVECCRPDHGYTHDSRAIKFLFEVLSYYDDNEQRMFLQFVTGSPRLPVGGFRALNPPLRIVRRNVEPPQNVDKFLPSVMTCVNYLKLPDYTCVEVMKERLQFAVHEGQHSFHLS